MIAKKPAPCRPAHPLNILIMIFALGAWAGDGDLLYQWVQFNGLGDLEARAVVANCSDCPTLDTGNGPVSMEERAACDDDFPITVCFASVTPGMEASIAGKPLPIPADLDTMTHFTVVGDTGCRIKNEWCQDCNSSRKWPWGTIADAAARQNPDLVIQVGDYFYRESPCPAEKGCKCKGSPSGDKWETWEIDFFQPARRLLAAAPWIIARGNHEICGRGGNGWFRLMDPHPYRGGCADSQEGKAQYTPTYAVQAGSVQVIVMDSSKVSSNNDQAQLPFYEKDFQDVHRLAQRTDRPSWLIMHHPLWDIEEGTQYNTVLQQASRNNLPSQVKLLLAGHAHKFRWMSFEQSDDRWFPPLFITGNSGTQLDNKEKIDVKGIRFGENGPTVLDGQTVFKFGFTTITPQGEGWLVRRYSKKGKLKLACTVQDGKVTPIP